MSLSEEERRRIYEQERAKEDAKRDARERGSPRRVLKWFAIGCLSLILLFVTCVVIIVVVADQESDEEVANIGEWVKSANWQVVVPSMPTKTQTLSEGFSPINAVGIFLVIPITIKNIGDEGSTFSNWQLKLHDSRDREFDAADYSTQVAAQGGLFLEQINPGLGKTTVVVFDVPEDAIGLTLEIKGALFVKSGIIALGEIR